MNTELIRHRMLDLKMSPEALATKMGRCLSTVQKLIRGKATYGTLYLAAKALGVTLKEIGAVKKPRVTKTRNYTRYDKHKAA